MYIVEGNSFQKYKKDYSDYLPKVFIIFFLKLQFQWLRNKKKCWNASLLWTSIEEALEFIYLHFVVDEQFALSYKLIVERIGQSH